MDIPNFPFRSQTSNPMSARYYNFYRGFRTAFSVGIKIPHNLEKLGISYVKILFPIRPLIPKIGEIPY